MKEVDPNLPVNKLAALAVSKSNHQARDYYPASNITSMTPLPTIRWFGPPKDDLTGRKSGRFTVIGCALFRAGGKSNATRWVVKCKCGRYQMLTSKAVKKNSPQNACVECRRNINREFNGSRDAYFNALYLLGKK